MLQRTLSRQVTRRVMQLAFLYFTYFSITSLLISRNIKLVPRDSVQVESNPEALMLPPDYEMEETPDGRMYVYHREDTSEEYYQSTDSIEEESLENDAESDTNVNELTHQMNYSEPVKSDLTVKKHNVMFLKIQKCYSTTVQTILVRFADFHNLSVVLPKAETFVNDIPAEIPRKARTPNGKYNVFVYHARVNLDLLDRLMHPDTVYVTILRAPIDRFVSHYMWFRKTKLNVKTLGHIGLNDYIVKVLRPQQKGVKFLQQTNLMLSYFNDFETSFSLGNMNKKFEKWDEIFDLVMIAEYFDESIILLKDLLGWSYDDVIYFEMNQRRKEQNDTELDRKSMHYLEKWTRGDRMLYYHYLDKLLEKIGNYGVTRMAEDKMKLQNRRRYWKNLCVSKTGINSEIKARKTHRHHTRDDSVVYEMSKEGSKYPLCRSALTTELHYRRRLINKQATLIQSSHDFPT